MNKKQSEQTLMAAAPKYTVSDKTKNAFKTFQNSVNGKTKLGQQVNDITDKLINFGEFDPNKSAYYQKAFNALKETYQNKGQQSMKETMASVAANNNQGYGSSYATTAGNQAFQQQLNALASKIPTLYSAASGEFENRRSALESALGAANNLWQNEVNGAQFGYNAYSGLDQMRYNSDIYSDEAKRDLAKLVLTKG